ncbi:MAG: group II intron reverse transcriptase/maturase [Nitrosomonas sp.]
MTLSGEDHRTTAMRDDSGVDAKSFEIPKRLIWEAWKRVAANQGGPGVDKESIEIFRNRLARNLYALWNRMSSGSYFPQPVKEVLIPKGDGQFRPLGIPTVTDRVAQMAVKLMVEPRIDAIFHSSSFGYRPNKSAHQAVTQARNNCWRYAWVVDIDLKSFFDTIDHELLTRAVEKHVAEPWARLYIRRWLESPVRKQTGEMLARDRGTPQGGVISPLLANLFLHYAFDRWDQTEYPEVPFERYADDVVCHCRTKQQAEKFLSALRERLTACGLTLHPEKTRLVYCKDGRRREEHLHTKFDFLGFSFHARTMQNREGQLFTGFGPAVSQKALKRMSQAIRSMSLNRSTSSTLPELARRLNPMVRGWVNYYGAFYPEPLKRFLIRIDLRLGGWARNKYKRLRGHKRQSWAWLKRCRENLPQLFAHRDFCFGERQARRAV